MKGMTIKDNGPQQKQLFKTRGCLNLIAGENCCQD